MEGIGYGKEAGKLEVIVVPVLCWFAKQTRAFKVKVYHIGDDSIMTDIADLDYDGRILLHFVCSFGGRVEVVACLLEFKVDASIRGVSSSLLICFTD